MSSMRLGQAQDDAVVAPQHLHGQVGACEPLLERERPRRVHARAERREDADAPVADLVGEALDHDRAVVGDRAGRLALLVEVARAGSTPRARRGRRRAAALRPASGDEVAQLARPCAPSARPSSSGRPGRSPRQNGVLRRLARRGRDDDAVERDLLDPPRGRAEHERLAGAALVHHLLVELADARRRRGGTRRTGRGRGSCRRSRSRRVARLREPRTRPCTRSHTTRGRSPANRSDG